MMLKMLFVIALLFLFLSASVSAREIYLTEPEYQKLMGIIEQSKANSEEQTALIADLKETLKAHEADLSAALNALELSESDLTELKSSLLKIRNYSAELSEYCKTLEKENAKLARSNTAWKITSGAGGGVIIVLLLLLCL